MRKGTKAAIVRELREIGERLNRAVDSVALSEEKEFTFSVAWPGDEGTKIQINDRWIQREVAEEIAAGAIWALFESRRPGNDPGHERTFEEVVERVMKMAEARCHQRPRSADAPPHTCRRTRGPKDGDSEEYCAGCRYQGAKEREAEWLRPRSADAPNDTRDEDETRGFRIALNRVRNELGALHRDTSQGTTRETSAWNSALSAVRLWIDRHHLDVAPRRERATDPYRVAKAFSVAEAAVGWWEDHEREDCHFCKPTEDGAHDLGCPVGGYLRACSPAAVPGACAHPLNRRAYPPDSECGVCGATERDGIWSKTEAP